MPKFRVVIRGDFQGGNEIAALNNVRNLLLKKMIHQDGEEYTNGEGKSYIISVEELILNGDH